MSECCGKYPFATNSGRPRLRNRLGNLVVIELAAQLRFALFALRSQVFGEIL